MNEIERLAAEAAAAEAAKVDEPGTTDAPAEPDAAEIEAEARRYGWKPREEWKGDATNWTDAPTYVEYARTAPATIKRLSAKLEQQERDRAAEIARIDRFMEESTKRLREQHAAELEAARRQQREAVQSADQEAWEAARKREDALRASAPLPDPAPAPKAADVPPEVAEWKARNTWFDSDPDMRKAAIVLAQKATDAGLPVAGQLAYVDREIGAMFPDRVAKPAPQQRQFAPVDGGSLALPGKRGKGWADIPAAERELIRKHHIGLVYKTEAEAAKAYWEENH